MITPQLILLTMKPYEENTLRKLIRRIARKTGLCFRFDYVYILLTLFCLKCSKKMILFHPRMTDPNMH